jgi:hypothetical protein
MYLSEEEEMTSGDEYYPRRRKSQFLLEKMSGMVTQLIVHWFRNSPWKAQFW